MRRHLMIRGLGSGDLGEGKAGRWMNEAGAAERGTKKFFVNFLRKLHTISKF